MFLKLNILFFSFLHPKMSLVGIMVVAKHAISIKK